jgi:hypothetical protein
MALIGLFEPNGLNGGGELLLEIFLYKGLLSLPILNNKK